MIVRMVYANYSINYSATNNSRGNCMKDKKEERRKQKNSLMQSENVVF